MRVISDRRVPVVYMGGKISHTDWRHSLAKQLRDSVSGYNTKDHQYGFEEPVWVFENELLYGGPFFRSCDHGGGHGISKHGMGARVDNIGEGILCGTLGEACLDYSGSCCIENSRKFVVNECIRALNLCDFMYVWVGADFDTAHGTHFEMGYARALGKPVFIGMDPTSVPDEVRCATWFPLMAGNHVAYGMNPVDLFVGWWGSDIRKLF